MKKRKAKRTPKRTSKRTSYTPLERAAHSYRQNRTHWDFLGYSEAVALAVLTDFFGMPKVRNPSEHPLNVTSMVGRSRIQAIKAEVEQSLAEGEDADASEANGLLLESSTRDMQMDS